MDKTSFNNHVARIQSVIRCYRLVSPPITSFVEGTKDDIMKDSQVCVGYRVGTLSRMDFPEEKEAIQLRRKISYRKGCVPEGPFEVKIIEAGPHNKDLVANIYNHNSEIYCSIVILKSDDFWIGFFNTSCSFNPDRALLESPSIKAILLYYDLSKQSLNKKTKAVFVLSGILLGASFGLGFSWWPVFVLFIILSVIIRIMLIPIFSKNYINVFTDVIGRTESRLVQLNSRTQSLCKMTEDDPRIDEEIEKNNREIERLESLLFSIRTYKELKGFSDDYVTINPHDLLEYSDIVSKLDYDEAYKGLGL